MTGEILENRVFICYESKLYYMISGVYDAWGNIRTEWKFKKGHQAEAVEKPDGTVIIKFEP